MVWLSVLHWPWKGTALTDIVDMTNTKNMRSTENTKKMIDGLASDRYLLAVNS